MTFTLHGPLGPMTRVERVGLAVALLLATALMWPLRHYLTDDTFIHLQYARNLATGHGLVFNPGERVYGCTSPLWVALIADGMAFGFNGLHVARVLGLSVLASGFFGLSSSYAATPAGYAEYIVPFDEDVFAYVTAPVVSVAIGANDTTEAFISVTAWADNVKLYYDHWENGYNFDPSNPAATALVMFGNL